jgi:type II secretory pathway predicted ATPase ExeA
MSQLAYWSLQRLPFGPPRRSSEFFPGNSQREAVARLQYLIEHGRPSAVVVGEPSVGRTVLLRHIAGASWQLAPMQQSLWIEPTSDGRQMLEQIAFGLGIGKLPSSKGWRAIIDQSLAASRGGARTVLLVDDAELAQPEDLRTLSRLVGACPAISIIVSAREGRQGEVLEAIGGCPLRVELTPWELSEIRDYLHQGVRLAGGRSDIFTDQAAIRLLELSEGLPGILSRLAELALLTGAGCQVPRIGPELIDAAANELFVSLRSTN